MENKEKSRIDDLIKKYKIDVEKLKKEQLRLAKGLKINDKIDFSLADSFGAFDNTFIGNKMLSCIVVCDKNFEVTDRAYSFEKVKFPYIPGFRNYRELPAMLLAFEKLSEKPDVVFIPAQGIIHPRLGLASHFSLSTGIPVIGVSNSIVDCEINKGYILRENKRVGKVLISKQGSNPMYISPGNFISIETAHEISKKLINPPHKRPEPLHLASKYLKKVRKELAV
ncbi:hypothetical protein GF386_00655 [Candidatus Pacearchaeota archaeon]|nr:hypothetical protein [Candidatus Pacearchaeota archaeon]MBD3282766.1 hypothetical protein [Candidatus Pacearchaeota archaeon]